MAAAAAVLVLLVALVVITLRRRQSERSHVARLRDREERLKLALWATGERYCDYDVASGRVNRLALDTHEDPGGRLGEDAVALGPIIHPDDLPVARHRTAQARAGGNDPVLGALPIRR